MVALMAHVDTPKISFPFALVGNGSAVKHVEQGSDEEVLDCVEVLLSTEAGERIEVPDYGVSPQVFREGGASIEEIMDTIRVWEDRAEAVIERDPGELDKLTDRLLLAVKGRGNA